MHKSEIEQLLLEVTKETTLFPKIEVFTEIAVLVNNDFNT